MSRKDKVPVIIENVRVFDIADDGKAVGRADDMIVFISHAVPGDTVDVRITKKRKKYVEAVPVRFTGYSEWRVKPECSCFEVCGGCKWQDFDYEKQLFYKHKNVSDCLERIGKLDIPEILPVLPANPTYYYRNKLEFTFSSSRWLSSEEILSKEEITDRNALGFHIPNKYDKVLDIDHCCLQADPSNAIRTAVRSFARKENMSFFDIRKNEGFLRTLVIRISSTGEIMVIINFYYEDETPRKKLMDFIREEFPEITSLMYVINPKPHDSFADLDVLPYGGAAYIMEEMEGLRFKIGPKSFYQTNSKQAHRLYEVVRGFAELTGNEIVYDLYTGTGTIANFVASKARKVIGVECIKEAVEDAKFNSSLNGIENTLFYAGDMKDVFSADFMQNNGMPDVVILDPPRAGVHAKVIEALLVALPKKIVYISCNPASQARDLALLQDRYRIAKVQPVDMFPHTHHVENVAELCRKI
jgi:23S rRNA (uracil1939-C5)-methyltransferase